MRIKQLFLSVSLSVCVIVSGGCSKEKNTPIESEESVSLLSRIPANSVGFLSWDNTTEAFKKYQNSKFASSSSDITEIVSYLPQGQADPAGLEALQDLSAALGLDLPKGSPLKITRGVAFLGVQDDTKAAEFGFVLEAASEGNATEIFESLKKLVLHGAEVISRVSGGRDYVSVVTNEVTLNIATENGLIAVARSTKAVEQLLSTPSVKAHPLTTTELFKKTSKKLGERKNELAFGYVDTQKIFDLLPTEDLIAVDLGVFPLTTFAFTRQMHAGPNEKFIITLQDDTEQSRQWSELLRASGKMKVISSIPASAQVVLGIDGGTVKGLKEAIELEMANLVSPERRQQIEALGELDSLGFGLITGTGASLFPDIFLLMDSPRAKDLTALVDSLANELISHTATVASPWQSKMVAGTKARYLQSPMGIGLWIADTPNTALFSSAETGLAAALSSVNGEDSIVHKLPANATEMLNRKDLLAFAFVDGDRIASVVKTFVSSLSMFYGSQAPNMSSIVEGISQIGILVFGMQYKDHSIVLETQRK